MPSAVLFDMDGTLIDTEPWWFLAEESYAGEHGAVWTIDDAMRMVGRPLIYTAQELRDFTGSDDDAEYVMDYLCQFMVRKIQGSPLPWRPGVPGLIEQLREADVPVALVTSSLQSIADAVISGLPAGFFDVVVSGSDVRNLKPHPEPYLTAMSRLGITPDRAVVIEDSHSGLGSGHAAGANVIGIPCVLELPAAPNLSRFGSAVDITLADLREIAAGRVIDRLGA